MDDWSCGCAAPDAIDRVRVGRRAGRDCAALSLGPPLALSFCCCAWRNRARAQATVGDCNMPRPGMVDFTGKSKWDAWDSAKGVKTPEAMTKYIETIKAQRAKYGE